MSNRPRYFGNRGISIQLTPVNPPSVVRQNSYMYKILREDKSYNLSNHYIEVYVNGHYFRDYQGELLSLDDFSDLIQPSFIEYQTEDSEEWEKLIDLQDIDGGFEIDRPIEIRIEGNYAQWIYADLLESETTPQWNNIQDLTTIGLDPTATMLRLNKDHEYLELTFKAKRIIHGYNHYSDTVITHRDYNLVVSPGLLCSDYLTVNF